MLVNRGCNCTSSSAMTLNEQIRINMQRGCSVSCGTPKYRKQTDHLEPNVSSWWCRDSFPQKKILLKKKKKKSNLSSWTNKCSHASVRIKLKRKKIGFIEKEGRFSHCFHRIQSKQVIIKLPTTLFSECLELQTIRISSPTSSSAQSSSSGFADNPRPSLLCDWPHVLKISLVRVTPRHSSASLSPRNSVKQHAYVVRVVMPGVTQNRIQNKTILLNR